MVMYGNKAFNGVYNQYGQRGGPEQTPTYHIQAAKHTAPSTFWIHDAESFHQLDDGTSISVGIRKSGNRPFSITSTIPTARLGIYKVLD